MPDPNDYETLYRVALRRALASSEPTLLQVHVSVEVLDRYREDKNFSIFRTNTVGRVHKQGGWSLDFGISPVQDMLHVGFGQLVSLPEAEREHFAAHATLLSASKTFLSMRMSPGSCFDDGEVRTWDASAS
jgi:hypothetical protein